MIIKDKDLGKYEIHHDGNNYSVIENTGKKNKDGDPIFKNHAYCSNVCSAINTIVKLLIEGKEEVYDLKGYLYALREVTDSVNKKFGLKE